MYVQFWNYRTDLESIHEFPDDATGQIRKVDPEDLSLVEYIGKPEPLESAVKNFNKYRKEFLDTFGGATPVRPALLVSFGRFTEEFTDGFLQIVTTPQFKILS